jgi:hypothetical protein
MGIMGTVNMPHNLRQITRSRLKQQVIMDILFFYPMFPPTTLRVVVYLLIYIFVKKSKKVCTGVIFG